MFSAQQFPMITPQMTQGAQEAGQQTAGMIQQGLMFPQMYQQMANQNALLGEQAQFYPQTAQAEIAQKLAESGYLNSQANINQFELQSPAYINPEGYLYSAGGQFNRTPFNQQNNSGNVPPVSGSNTQVAGSQAPGSTNTSSNTNSSGTDIMGDPLGAYGYIQSPNDPFTPGSAAQQHGFGGDYTKYENAANAYQSAYNELIYKAGDAASLAQQMGYQINKMQSNYPLIDKWQKGGIYGNVPALLDSPAQNFDTAAQTLNTGVARGFQSMHITDSDFAIANKMGGNRTLNPTAFNSYISGMQGIQQRVQEEPGFYAAAHQLQIPPQIAASLWPYYNKQRPVLDPKTNAIIPGNLNSYNDFLNINAIHSMLAGQPYSPRLAIPANNQQTAVAAGAPPNTQQNISASAIANTPAAQQNGIAQVNLPNQPQPSAQQAPLNQNVANQGISDLAKNLPSPPAGFTSQQAINWLKNQTPMVKRAYRLKYGLA